MSNNDRNGQDNIAEVFPGLEMENVPSVQAKSYLSCKIVAQDSHTSLLIFEFFFNHITNTSCCNSVRKKKVSMLELVQSRNAGAALVPALCLTA